MDLLNVRTDYLEVINQYNSLVYKYNAEQRRHLDEYNALVDKYNTAIRLNNLLAIYSLMPRYTPSSVTIYQQPYQPPPQRSIHCTTNTVGNFTETNCN
jgi:hypothetical protein